MKAESYRNETLGVEFQRNVRSLEWKAALIVHDKHRRKLQLGHADLVSLRDFAKIIVAQRKESGKEPHKDWLVQELSAELKRRAKDR